jgi:hypothetical protein
VSVSPLVDRFNRLDHHALKLVSSTITAFASSIQSRAVNMMFSSIFFLFNLFRAAVALTSFAARDQLRVASQLIRGHPGPGSSYQAALSGGCLPMLANPPTRRVSVLQ